MLKLKPIFLILFTLLFSAEYLLFANNSQALYEQGIEAFKSGNFGSSELLLRKIIDSGESEYKDRAWYHLALAIFNQKKYQSAVFEFNRFLSSCSTSDLCSLSRYWIAESYYQLNDNIRAIQEFNRFIAQSKNNEYIAQSYDRIGRIYFTQRRYDEAIIEWMKALGKSNDTAKNNQKRLNIGEAYFLNENYDEAINFLLPIINSNIDTKTLSMAKLLTGRAYQIKGKHTTAIKTFSSMDETLLTEKPFNDVQYYRAVSYIALGNLNFAALHLKTFLSTGKESKWIYYAKYELARIFIKDNNIKEASQLLEEIRSADTDPTLISRASMELSRIFFDKDIEESIKYLKEASDIESPQEKKEVLLLLSKAYTKTGRFNEAESLLEYLVTNYSFDKDIDLFQFLLATVYFEKGDIEKTKKAFDRLKEVNPFSKYLNESHFYSALSNKKNNIDESINLLNKYVNFKNSERKYDAYVKLLNLYCQKRDFKNTERISSVIISIYSKNKDVEDVLYKYAKFLNDNRKSNKYLHDIIIKKYSKSEAAGKILLSLGDDAFVKKNYKAAEYYYRQYLSVQWRQNAASVFLYRILSLERLGRHKDIITTLESENSIPPMDDFTAKQVSLLKSKSYYKTGEYEKAYKSYSTWRLSDLSEDDLVNMVKCSLKVDDTITALKASDLIKKNENALAEAFYELGMYFMHNNDYETAVGYFTRIIAGFPSSGLIDPAKLELADIYIKDEKHDSAIQILKEIKSKTLQLRKNALLIVACFRIGNDKEAVTLTNKYFNALRKSPYGEIVIKENIFYYYNNKNIKQFNKYTQHLKKYPGNNVFINYHSARLNFETSNYKTSYFYYYKLAELESEYNEEALFYLGLISLLNNNDKNLAQKYFSKISSSNNSGSKFAMQGKIDLSILSSETGNITASREALYDIMDNSDSRLLRIQAENLIEYFGYKKAYTIKQ